MSEPTNDLRERAEQIAVEIHKLSKDAAMSGFHLGVHKAGQDNEAGRSWPLYAIVFEPKDGSGDAQLIVPDFGAA